ncbi:MAG: SDR family oxidoreductase [Phaeodactylibacter sp.]|uniref:SDR family oxidoreductase n=1 Tax=Phaeodactylibacter sp. TaxID=1940289 RepID=UPI0032EAFFCA
MSKIILITGASSGLGQALAYELSRQGHTVFGTSRSPKGDQGNIRMTAMDVQKESSVQAAVQQVVREAGRLDVVINNAGIGIAGPLEESKMEEIEQVMDTNILGVIRVCRAVLPIMRQQGKGQIFTISSIGARVGLPYRSIYCASKAAVDLITESLRLEVRRFGIQVTGIHAGDIQTNINANRIKTYNPEGAYAESFARAYQIIDQEVEEGMPAEAVAQTIARRINREPLHPFYAVGKPLQRLSLVLKRLLPNVWFERLIARYSKV